jgi:hypothetical protein
MLPSSGLFLFSFLLFSLCFFQCSVQSKSFEARLYLFIASFKWAAPKLKHSAGELGHK